MVLAALSLIVAQVGCIDPHFITQPTACLCISAVRRRAIALQDNDRDNRVAAKRLVVSGADDKIGVSLSSAERCFRKRKPRLRFIALLYSHHPFRAVLSRHQETAECDGGLQPISYQVYFSVQVTPTAWSDTLRSPEGAKIRPLFQIREMQQLLVDLLRPDVRA